MALSRTRPISEPAGPEPASDRYPVRAQRCGACRRIARAPWHPSGPFLCAGCVAAVMSRGSAALALETK